MKDSATVRRSSIAKSEVQSGDVWLLSICKIYPRQNTVCRNALKGGGTQTRRDLWSPPMLYKLDAPTVHGHF